jgi:ABC-2 type transport system permease protein
MGEILRRELGAYFGSAAFWIGLAIFQLLLAFLFLSTLEYYGRIQLAFGRMDYLPGVTGMVAAPLFEHTALFSFFLVPLLTMRLLAEERRVGTLRFLFSTPVSVAGICLGKYLALAAALLALAGMALLIPLTLLAATPLDLPHLACAFLGLWLFLLALGAFGLFCSALTALPVASATITYVSLLLLWILDRADVADEDPLAHYLSPFVHLRVLLRGVLGTVDVVYFLLAVVVFLTLAVWRVGGERRGVL